MEEKNQVVSNKITIVGARPSRYATKHSPLEDPQCDFKVIQELSSIDTESFEGENKEGDDFILHSPAKAFESKPHFSTFWHEQEVSGKRILKPRTTKRRLLDNNLFSSVREEDPMPLPKMTWDDGKQSIYEKEAPRRYEKVHVMECFATEAYDSPLHHKNTEPTQQPMAPIRASQIEYHDITLSRSPHQGQSITDVTMSSSERI